MFIKDSLLARKQYAESINENGYWFIINKINKITNGNKKDYYIYIDPSANIWTKFENPDSALFFYPAMTGIVCIGELYFKDGQLYLNNETPKIGPYYYKPKVEDAKLTKEDAYNKAKLDGKKALIYIYNNTMSVINID